jgi:uncharacterized protein (DUF342 family)
MHCIKAHLQEYREQIEEHRRAIIALTGAIQALERLQKETETEEGDNNSGNPE